VKIIALLFIVISSLMYGCANTDVKDDYSAALREILRKVIEFPMTEEEIRRFDEDLLYISAKEGREKICKVFESTKCLSAYLLTLPENGIPGYVDIDSTNIRKIQQRTLRGKSVVTLEDVEIEQIAHLGNRTEVTFTFNADDVITGRCKFVFNRNDMSSIYELYLLPKLEDYNPIKVL